MDKTPEQLSELVKRAKHTRFDTHEFRTVSGPVMHTGYVQSADPEVIAFFAQAPATIEALIEKLGTLQRALDQRSRNEGQR